MESAIDIQYFIERQTKNTPQRYLQTAVITLADALEVYSDRIKAHLGRCGVDYVHVTLDITDTATASPLTQFTIRHHGLDGELLARLTITAVEITEHKRRHERRQYITVNCNNSTVRTYLSQQDDPYAIAADEISRPSRQLAAQLYMIAYINPGLRERPAAASITRRQVLNRHTGEYEWAIVDTPATTTGTPAPHVDKKYVTWEDTVYTALDIGYRAGYYERTWGGEYDDYADYNDLYEA